MSEFESPPKKAELHLDSIPDDYKSWDLFKRMWRKYLRPNSGWMAISMVLMLIEGSTLGFLAYLLEPMFDKIFVGGNTDAIWVLGGIIVGLFLLRAVSSMIQKAVLTMVAQRTSSAMQKDLLGHLMRLDSQFFQKNPPGALMERLVGDTNAVQGVWNTFISGVGRDIVSLIALLVVAIQVDWFWTVVTLSGAPLLILPVVVAQRYIKRKSKMIRREASFRSTQLDEIFHGINSVKLNVMETYQQKRFDNIIKKIVRARIKMAASRSVIPAFIDLLSGVGFFIVLYVGGHDIIAGEKTVGQFMSFFTAMSLAFQPMRRLGGVAGGWQVAATSLQRLYVVFDTQPSIISPHTPLSIDAANGDIALKEVVFSYEDSPVLHGTTFTAEAGKTTALVGASGAGKSTVFGLLTRLHEPQYGEIRIGAHQVSEFTLADLRETFSVVTQDAFLFDETIRDNILMGRKNISDARLQEALDAAHVSEFLPLLPNGVDSAAGPRGSNLSGGQRQRVAIARALLRQSPILLLDEATSALDVQSEVLVQEALDKLSKDRTTIVIAHRLSTVRNADKIVVMDRGEVVEQGTHDELLAKGGAYAELYTLQFNTPDQVDEPE